MAMCLKLYAALRIKLAVTAFCVRQVILTAAAQLGHAPAVISALHLVSNLRLYTPRNLEEPDLGSYSPAGSAAMA